MLRSEAGAHDLFIAQNAPHERRGNVWVRATGVLLVAVALVFLVRQLLPLGAPALPSGEVAAAAPTLPGAMEQPLHLSAISAAVRQAVLNGHDQAALLSASAECNRILRQAPTVFQLDRCAAFDDAVVQLHDRDAMWDEGPFSQLSVTGRQWSAASSLSNDYLAIDSGRGRIRVEIELALVPPSA